METLLVSALKKYFEVFIRDFDPKKHFTFKLAKGEVIVASFGTPLLHNPIRHYSFPLEGEMMLDLLPVSQFPFRFYPFGIELNESTIRELIGVETLDIKRLYISNCLLNVREESPPK